MTFGKMIRILTAVLPEGTHGCVVATSGGEIALDFNSQPTYAVHRALLRLGFVTQSDTCLYVYRPR